MSAPDAHDAHHEVQHEVNFEVNREVNHAVQHEVGMTQDPEVSSEWTRNTNLQVEYIPVGSKIAPRLSAY